jgi:hypothetical protein
MRLRVLHLRSAYQPVEKVLISFHDLGKEVLFSIDFQNTD